MLSRWRYQSRRVRVSTNLWGKLVWRKLRKIGKAKKVAHWRTLQPIWAQCQATRACASDPSGWHRRRARNWKLLLWADDFHPQEKRARCGLACLIFYLLVTKMKEVRPRVQWLARSIQSRTAEWRPWETTALQSSLQWFLTRLDWAWHHDALGVSPEIPWEECKQRLRRIFRFVKVTIVKAFWSTLHLMAFGLWHTLCLTSVPGQKGHECRQEDIEDGVGDSATRGPSMPFKAFMQAIYRFPLHLSSLRSELNVVFAGKTNWFII